jgi:hypothetical protein
MRRRLTKVAAMVGVLAALAVGGSTLASATQKANPPKAPAVSRPQPTNQAPPAGEDTADGTTADTDNVQQGDQSAPDTKAEQAGEKEGGAESELGTEPEQGQPGEPAVGHEDPAGQDVNHECTGDCVE